MNTDDLSSADRDVLAQAMSRILPSGPGPGANDARAIGYVDWLSTQTCRVSMLPRVHTLIDLLQRVAASRYNSDFRDCSGQQQDEILRVLESAPDERLKGLLVMLIRVTLAGAFCAPRYGGNRDQIWWLYMGFQPDE